MALTVSVHLDAEVARGLLLARGWVRPEGGGWRSPDGSHYWQVDEALTVALEADSGAPAGPGRYVAEMETDHYSWRATGSTEALARAALAEGWDAHLAAVALEDGGPGSAEPDSTGEQALDYYGARVWQSRIGVCYRDETEVANRSDDGEPLAVAFEQARHLAHGEAVEACCILLDAVAADLGVRLEIPE